MSTVIRAELSKRNEYHIEKHRYYELKHYCLQYNLWKRALLTMNVYPTQEGDKVIFSNSNPDPTAELAQKRLQYLDKIEMLDRVALEADPIIGPLVLKGIVLGLSYEALRTRMDVPCGKDFYYIVYRKFFWILDKVRK